MRAIRGQARSRADQPYVHRIRDTDHLGDGDIVALEAKTGIVRSLYRPYERHHHLFATARCNSNCLMCSQPPKDQDDVVGMTERNRELIRLIDPQPNYLTITGGEPTLLGDNLFALIGQLRDEMAATEIHILTNGRTFAWPEYARRFAQVGHPNISLGVPLYSDFAASHDYVVQARGAFDQTVAGLSKRLNNGIRVEIRVSSPQTYNSAPDEARRIYISQPHICRACRPNGVLNMWIHAAGISTSYGLIPTTIKIN